MCKIVYDPEIENVKVICIKGDIAEWRIGGTVFRPVIDSERLNRVMCIE